MGPMVPFPGPAYPGFGWRTSQKHRGAREGHPPRHPGIRRTKKTPIDWAHRSRRDWLLKARRLRERRINTSELYEQAKALFA